MGKNSLKINDNLCIRCGICAEVCPVAVISMDTGKPTSDRADFCISCGHCVAHCPKAAVQLDWVPLRKQKKAGTVLSSKRAELFLRQRRSVRRYKKEVPDHELMAELLRVARCAPSGGNSQGLSFRVIENREILDDIIGAVVDFMENGVKSGKLPKVYGEMVAKYRADGQDFILRGAPCLVVSHAHKKASWAKDNTRFALAYAELYAPSLGLGSCWAGFLEMCAFSGDNKLLELMQLPEEHVFCGAIMAGFPQYHSFRLVDRKPLQISWL